VRLKRRRGHSTRSRNTNLANRGNFDRPGPIRIVVALRKGNVGVPFITMHANEPNRLRRAKRRCTVVDVKGLVLHSLKGGDHGARRSAVASVNREKLGGDSFLAYDVGESDGRLGSLTDPSNVVVVQAFANPTNLPRRVLVKGGVGDSVSPANSGERIYLECLESVTYRGLEGVTEVIFVAATLVECFGIQLDVVRRRRIFLSHLCSKMKMQQ
jgi:hypothetical protein